MKKSTFILVLLMAFAPLLVNAQTQNVELGLQVGAGFFMGNSNPATGYTRIHEFAWMRDSEGIPAFETFGGVVRYRFDYRWALQAQAMRQRTRFKESAENTRNVRESQHNGNNVCLRRNLHFLCYTDETCIIGKNV